MGGMVLYGGKMGRKEEEWKRNRKLNFFITNP